MPAARDGFSRLGGGMTDVSGRMGLEKRIKEEWVISGEISGAKY